MVRKLSSEPVSGKGRAEPTARATGRGVLGQGCKWGLRQQDAASGQRALGQRGGTAAAGSQASNANHRL